MNKEKQIEEMAKAIAVARGYGCTEQYHCDMSCQVCKCGCIPHEDAQILYNAGYRKQIEGEWIAKDNFNGRCTIATCSNCGTEKAFAVLASIDTIATIYPYCQKCGAKMKGGAE